MPVRPDTAKKRDTILVPIPPHADSLLRDSLRKRDSLKGDTTKQLPRDTVKAPLARAELPPELQIERTLHWNRDSLFNTGAITLADLLERVPGLTMLHSGWVMAPATPSYMGDIRRVRVFIDGMQIDGLDPRNEGVLDLTQINLWAMEEVTIEPTASEVRVYMRTWRVRYTTPDTRTDVSTGDQQTNLFRGFYGRRANHGEVVQLGAEQLSCCTTNIFGGGGTATGIVGRVGWARPGLTVDGFISRISRSRSRTLREFGNPGDSIPSVSSSRTDMYFRVAGADPDTSPVWWQAMVVGSKYDYGGVRTRTIPFPKTAADSAFNNIPLDTNTFRTQYVLTGGTARGPLRVSLTNRLFASGGKSIITPSVRASIALGRWGLSAFAEGKSSDSIARSDVTARFTPLSFVALQASAGRASDHRVADSSFSASYLRGEAGIRLHNLWFLGGILRRDSVRLSPPVVYDTLYLPVREPPATGITASIRGQVWRLIHADVWAVRWNDTTGFYRPRYQTRSELYLRTNMLERFPSGHLGILASIVHEYRSNVQFPAADLTAPGAAVMPAPAVGYRTISTLIEIRILTATISWQFRNFLGERYSQVPGFIMPRGTNFYGVRWSFQD